MEQNIRERLGLGLCNALAVLAACAPICYQAWFPGGAYEEPDCTAYLLTAKQIARHHAVSFDASDMYRFHEHMWEESNGRIYSKYPPGYALLLAVAYRLGGDHAMPWVSPICGAIGLLAAYGLMRQMVRSGWALLGAVYLASTPIAALYFNYTLTHAASFCVVTLGMLMAWQWWVRGGVAQAAAAGLLLGFVPAIRYPEAALAVPVALIILLRLLGVQPSAWAEAHPNSTAPPLQAWSRRLLEAGVFGMAAAIGLVLLMAYHLRAFGYVFRTGYWFTGEQSAFSLGMVWRNAPLLLHHLNDRAIFMLLPLSILGWSAFAVRRKWEGLVLALWALAMYAAYVGFYWAPPDGTIYVRFQIGALAAYAAAAMFFLAQGLVERRMRMVVFVAWVIPVIIVHAYDVNMMLSWRNRAVAEIVQRMEEIVPPDAVIFVDGPAEENLQASQNYLVYKLRMFYPSHTQSDWSRNPRGLTPRWEWAPRRQDDRRKRLVEYFSKDTKPLTEMERELVARRLREGRSVFFLTESRAAQGALGRLGPGFVNERVAEWESTYPWPDDENYKPVWQVNRIRLAVDSDPKSTAAAPPGGNAGRSARA